MNDYTELLDALLEYLEDGTLEMQSIEMTEGQGE